MSDDDKAASNDQATEAQPKVRWGLVLTTVVVFICLVAVTAIGSILVNVEWPTTAGAWFKAFLGGLLILISSLGMAYAGPAARGVIQDKGGSKDEHQDKYRGLEQLSRTSTWRKGGFSVVFTVVLIVGAVWLPRISVPPPPGPEPGTIILMSAIDESERDPRYTLIQQWNTAHPDNKVELITVSGETDAQHASMVNDATEERKADVYVLDIVWMPEFIARGYIQRVDESRLGEYSDDQFIANVWQTCADMAGKRAGRWALPFNADAGLMYYRPNIGAPEPKSWDDYFGAPAKETLARIRSTPRVSEAARSVEAANAAALARQEVLTVTALEAIWAAGGEVVNQSGVPVRSADGNEVVFDGNAQAGIRDLAAAVEDPDIVLPGSEEADESVTAQAFEAGRVLMMRNWPVQYDVMMEGDQEVLPFEVAALPHPSVLGGQNLAISSNTDKPRAAQELIEFLTSPSSQLTLFEIGGYAPTRPSAYINSSRPYAQDLRSAIERARLRPILVHYTEFSVEFRDGVRGAINGGGELPPGLARKLADIVKKG